MAIPEVREIRGFRGITGVNVWGKLEVRENWKSGKREKGRRGKVALILADQYLLSLQSVLLDRRVRPSGAHAPSTP